MPDANSLGWIVASVTILFIIWMALRAEARKDKGMLKTREERMLEEINGLKETVQTLLVKLNESQREIDSLEVRLKAALARITEVEIMYEIMPGQPITRLSPKRKLHTPQPPTGGHEPGDDLRNALTSLFSATELQALCADLGANYEDMEGDGKAAKTLSIIAYFQRRGELAQLTAAVKERRPHAQL